MTARRGPGLLLVDVSPLRDSPAFRRMFVSRLILLFGVGMVSVTVPVHVFLLTGSTVLVGSVTSVEGLAFLCGFLFGGVVTDRFDRWRILQVVRIGTVASFVGLTVNALVGGPVWLIGLLVAINGVSGATAITATLAVLPGLVGRSRLHAVGALNTLSIRLGTTVAPVVGGAVAATAGPAWSYGLGAVTALLTVTMNRRPRPAELAVDAGGLPGPAPPPEPPLRALRSGYRHILGDRVVSGVMAAGVVGMLGAGSRVLLPAFASARFGNAPFVVGLMYSAMSAGLVLGTVSSGWVRRVARPGRLLLLLMVLCFLCFAAAGAAPVLPVAVLGMAAAGMVNSVEEVLRYALLQQRTPEEFLGRVNSAFAAQNMSGVAVGAFVAGLVGAWIHHPVAAFWMYNVAMAAVSVLVLPALPTLWRHHASPDEEAARPAGKADA